MADVKILAHSTDQKLRLMATPPQIGSGFERQERSQ